MSKFIDLTGQNFGVLIVLEQIGKTKHGNYKWLCKCSCGNEIIIASGRLRNGNTKSCGCLQHPEKHGHKKKNRTPKTYIAWQGMIRRCTNPNYQFYAHYGGRGISVCKRWKIFDNFLKDMGEVPKKHQLDRIDNNGGYSPENCRWTTRKAQQRNKRNNHTETFNGITQCLTTWEEETGISQSTIRRRLKNNWSVEKALTTPVQKRKIYHET